MVALSHLWKNYIVPRIHPTADILCLHGCLWGEETDQLNQGQIDKIYPGAITFQMLLDFKWPLTQFFLTCLQNIRSHELAGCMDVCIWSTLFYLYIIYK